MDSYYYLMSHRLADDAHCIRGSTSNSDPTILIQVVELGSDIFLESADLGRNGMDVRRGRFHHHVLDLFEFGLHISLQGVVRVQAVVSHGFIHEETDLFDVVLEMVPVHIHEKIFDLIHLLSGLSAQASSDWGRNEPATSHEGRAACDRGKHFGYLVNIDVACWDAEIMSLERSPEMTEARLVVKRCF